MTTTGTDLDINDVYSSQQITRLAALQGVSEFVYVLPEKVVTPGVLIELAEYVIGEVEPFDPVAEAHKAMAAIKFERSSLNNYDDGEAGWTDMGGESGTLADWERELIHGTGRDVESVEREILDFVGDITVSDLAGFLTLPTTAILEDEDGDTWHHEPGGWTWGVTTLRIPAEIFMDFNNDDGSGFSFIVTNPEVLS